MSIDENDLQESITRWVNSVPPIATDELVGRTRTTRGRGRVGLTAAVAAMALLTGVVVLATRSDNSEIVEADVVSPPESSDSTDPSTGAEVNPIPGFPVAWTADQAGAVFALAVPGVGTVDLAIPATMGTVESASLMAILGTSMPERLQVSFFNTEPASLGEFECEASAPDLEGLPVECVGPEDVGLETPVLLWERVSGASGARSTAAEAVIAYDESIAGMVTATAEVEVLQSLAENVKPTFSDGLLAVNTTAPVEMDPALTSVTLTVALTDREEVTTHYRVSLGPCVDRGAESITAPDWVCTDGIAINVTDVDGTFLPDLTQMLAERIAIQSGEAGPATSSPSVDLEPASPGTAAGLLLDTEGPDDGSALVAARLPGGTRMTFRLSGEARTELESTNVVNSVDAYCDNCGYGVMQVGPADAELVESRQTLPGADGQSVEIVDRPGLGSWMQWSRDGWVARVPLANIPDEHHTTWAQGVQVAIIDGWGVVTLTGPLSLDRASESLGFFGPDLMLSTSAVSCTASDDGEIPSESDGDEPHLTLSRCHQLVGTVLTVQGPENAVRQVVRGTTITSVNRQ